MLSLTNTGKLILSAGHADWAMGIGDGAFTLSIDGGKPIPMKASVFDNIFLSPVPNDAIVDRLRRAKVLDWRLPNAHFRSEAPGLGVALDAVRRCKAGL